MASLIEVRHSSIHGTGVFAARAIPKEKEIVYYEGKLITHTQADIEEEDNGHTFLFTLNDEWVIEGAINGNESRWINHSCEPNCEALLIEDDDGDRRKDRIVIQAMRRIRAGEELTYDYNILTEEPFTDSLRELWRCRCGAPSCRGVILRPGVPEGKVRD